MSNIKIYNTDNLVELKKTPDKYYDLAIIDPPYGIGEDGGTNHTRSTKNIKSKKYISKGWDKSPPAEEFFIELVRVSKNQIIFGANHFIQKIPNADSSCWIVWNKVNGENDFADCELAYTSFKSAVRMLTYRWHGMLQQNMKNKEIRIHPTQKPVDLYKWILTKYAKQGDKILDTHLGSGSSAIACHDLHFDFTGYEIDQEYFNNAKKRLEQHQQQINLF